MNAEKEIVNLWLNKKGYFTINNVKVRNRDIGIIAIKFKDGVMDKVFHVDVTCSIAQNIIGDNKTARLYVKKHFEDPLIVKEVKRNIKAFLGRNVPYDKIAVLNPSPQPIKEQLERNNIKVIDIGEVLYDVMVDLDTQYYKDPLIRALQLLKHNLLIEPKKAAKLMSEILNQNTRPSFVHSLLEQDEIKKTLKRSYSEEQLISLIKHSTLKRPQRLVRALEEDLLTRRTRKSFFEALSEKLFGQKKEEPAKKPEKTLHAYFGG